MKDMWSSVSVNLLSEFLWVLLLSVPALIFWLWSKVKAIKLGVKFRRSGVSAFFPNRDSYATDRPVSLEAYLQLAKSSLMYSGHWLAVSTDQRTTLDALTKIVEAGKDVEIIMLSEDLSEEVMGAYASFFSRDKDDLKARIGDAWRRVKDWRSGLGVDRRKYVTLREHKEFVSNSAFYFDEKLDDQTILIDQKVWGLDRAKSYGIELKSLRKKGNDVPILFALYRDSLLKLKMQAAIIN